PTAGPLWEALARKYPQSTLADDAVYNQGVAARRNGELDKERALLQDLVNRFPSSDLRSDALFRLFWSRWSEGRPREGLVWLDQLAAIERLRLGLKTEAAREISAVDRSAARSGGEVGHEPLTLIAELYSRSGDLRSAHAIVRTELRGLLRRPASALALRAAALAYPLAFREQIARVSQGVAVPPDLLQALMREESALDPRALSPTGALGLTQVMPSTARMLARKLRLQGYQTARLLEPDMNIRIGGTYLGEL